MVVVFYSGSFLVGETQIRGERSQAGNQKSKMLQNPKPWEHQVDSAGIWGFQMGALGWSCLRIRTPLSEILLGTSALNKGCAGSVCPVLGVVSLRSCGGGG